jgi:hypothetical protein
MAVKALVYSTSHLHSATNLTVKNIKKQDFLFLKALLTKKLPGAAGQFYVHVGCLMT